MIEYDLVNGKLAIKPETLTVKAFKDIWDFDKSKTKELASSVLTYVFTMCDDRDKNPFKDIAYNEKEAACKKNAFGDKNFKIPDALVGPVEEAFAWYDFLNANAISRIFKAANVALDKVAHTITTTEVVTMDHAKAVMDQMKNLTGIIKGYQDAEKAMRGEREKARNKQGNTNSLRTRRLI